MTPIMRARERERLDELRAVENALDMNQMQTVFDEKVKERYGKKLQINDFHFEVLQRHNYRCVLRYCIDAYDPVLAKKVHWRVVGKVLKNELGELLFENMRQLWIHGFSRYATDGISIPEPLEFNPAISMLLQEEVPGMPVKKLLKQSPQKEHFRKLARTLAKLHKCAFVPNRIFKVKQHLQRCHPSHEYLAMACPQLTATIESIVEKAYEIEAGFGEIKKTPVHADFHLGQVHLENDRAWLIDFDVLSYGDPATDLGNLLVFLKGKAKTNPEIDELIEVFVAEYFSLMDRGIAARIPLYEGLSCLRRACKFLRLQGEGWQEKVEQMVKQSEATIDRMMLRSRSEDRCHALPDDSIAELSDRAVLDEVRR